MKKTLLKAIAFMLLALVANAQNDKPRESPKATAKGTAGKKTITIEYGQPSVKGRKIWGDLVPYGQVWRTGANESTSIEFSDDVEVEKNKVSKGKYALFTIPGEKEWTIIINKAIAWGAYSYKQEDDVVRFTVPVQKAKSFQEKLTFNVLPSGVVALEWENVRVEFAVK